MTTYKQLTKEQRYQIAALKKEGLSNKKIAKNIGTSEPTISREFKRNTGKRGYRPKQAHIKALWRKKNATKAIKMTAKVIILVNQQIRFDLSPEQVSGWLLKQHGIRLSHARIYQQCGLINAMVAIYMLICGKPLKNAARNTAQKTSADRFVIESVSSNVLLLLMKSHALVIGKSIP
jgi:IS30 family transposase